jgi:hypothetical protein
MGEPFTGYSYKGIDIKLVPDIVRNLASHDNTSNYYTEI